MVFAKPSVDKVGFDPDNDVGLYAGVAFGRKITPAWDWRVGLAFTNFEDNDTDGDDGTLTSELRFATADLEAGFAAVENTSTNLRFFGGLRILWEDDSAAADSVRGLRSPGQRLSRNRSPDRRRFPVALRRQPVRHVRNGCGRGDLGQPGRRPHLRV